MDGGARGWGKGGEGVHEGDRGSVREDEKALEVDSEGSGTAL